MRSAQGKDRTFSVATLGCKLNQYESECIRQDLVRSGWTYRDFGEGADFFIINTCTVTGKTDSRCRNVVRRARRISPDSVIIVTGCYAETRAEDLRSMDEIDIVVGNGWKSSIAGMMEDLVSGATSDGTVPLRRDPKSGIDTFLDHSRAFIKVQEGCDSACSYCIIPAARGKSRSVPPGEVLEQVKRLEKNGLEEIVLTGIHIGRYGIDLGGRNDLLGLLELLIDRTSSLRLRLSSIEVTEVSDGLLRLMSGSERLASHLHIPLQSGDDRILALMKRPYTTSFFRDRIEAVKSASEGIAVGTDIIVGFPGETEEHFGNTRKFLAGTRIDYFHVFSFSRRPGTVADGMSGQVSPEDKKRRSRKLVEMGKGKRRAFMIARTGKKELALIQGPPGKHSRFSAALTGSYCEVSIRCPAHRRGRLVPIDITHYSRGRLYGRLASEEKSGVWPEG